VQRVLVAAAGNVTINAPSSGTTLSIGSVSSTGVALALTGYRTSSMSGTLMSEVADGSGFYIDSSGSAPGYRISVNGILSTTWSANRNVTIAAPSSGSTLTVSGAAIQYVSKTTVARGGGNNWIDFQDPTGESGYIGFGSANSNYSVMNLLAASLILGTNNSQVITIASAGNVTINTPSSGNSLTVNGLASNYWLNLSDGTRTGGIVQGGAGIQLGVSSAHGLDFFTTNATRISIAAAGNVTISQPSSGQALAMTGTAAGTAALTINTSANTGGQTAVFTATNKPGAVNGAPTKWLPVIADSVTYYVPLFA
jgi:hypothetical protein